MRKDIADLVDVLGQSMTEIAASGADNRDELLKNSVGEFHTALMQTLDPVLAVERDQSLAKGVAPVAMFADVLRNAARDVELVKSSADPELSDDLDRFIDVGVLLLRGMANRTAEVADDSTDGAGQLVKIDGYAGEPIMVKSDLPADLHTYLTDPLDLMTYSADLSRSFADSAIEVADPLLKAELIPEELINGYPEIFEVEGEEPLATNPVEKAFPRRAPPRGAPAPDEEAADEDQDPDQDQDQDQDQGQDETDGLEGDGVANNPIELIVRMASIIVVVGGALLKSQDGAMTADGQQAPAAGGEMLQRSTPIEDVPLEKILRGEVEVSSSLAEALEERETLRKSMAELTQERDVNQASLKKMQELIDRLNAQPAAPKGAVFEVSKAGDAGLPGHDNAVEKSDRLQRLAESNPEAASRELLKIVHSGGGAPLLPPSGG